MFCGPFLICQTKINPNRINNKKSLERRILVIITPHRYCYSFVNIKKKPSAVIMNKSPIPSQKIGIVTFKNNELTFNL